MAKLISMVDYTLLNSKGHNRTIESSFNSCIEYAEFLKQRLTLEMFGPWYMPKNGKSEYDYINLGNPIPNSYELYEKAIDKVIFHPNNTKIEKRDAKPYIIIPSLYIKLYWYELESLTVERLIGLELTSKFSEKFFPV